MKLKIDASFDAAGILDLIQQWSFDAIAKKRTDLNTNTEISSSIRISWDIFFWVYNLWSIKYHQPIQVSNNYKKVNIKIIVHILYKI